VIQTLSDFNADIMKLPGYDGDIASVKEFQDTISNVSKDRQETVEKYKAQADAYMDMMAALSGDEVSVGEEEYSMSEFFYQY
jgi:hypothetical protein